MTTPKATISDLLVRIQDVFLNGDTPLTVRELQRRVKTDDITCRAVLGALIDAGVIVRIDGLYMRACRPGQPANPPSQRQAA